MNLIRQYFEPRMRDSVFVVVRSVGEHTAQRCVELLASQVGKENITVVRKHPFATALKSGLELGIAANKKWTLAVDADVLSTDSAVLKLFIEGELAAPHIFEIHSQILDKFFGGVRAGGMKLYRTALLADAVKLIPAPGEAHRPEATMIKRMRQKGYPFSLTPVVAGLHDFEQDYKDIFRKGYTHAAKSDAMLPILQPYWQREAQHDDDFKVLLAGVDYAVKEGKLNPQLDVNELPHNIEEILSRIVKPRRSLADKFPDVQAVEKFIDEFKSPPEYFVVAKTLADNMPQPQFGILRMLGRNLAKLV